MRRGWWIAALPLTALLCAPSNTSLVVQDEGAAVSTNRPAINFVGAGVACVDSAANNRADCTIGGGAGSNGFGTIGAAIADVAADTLTVTDSATIDFTTTDGPEDITAIVVAGSIGDAQIAATSGNGTATFTMAGINCAASSSFLGVGSNTPNCDTTEGNVDIVHSGPTMTVGNLKCIYTTADATCDAVVTIRKNGAASAASTCSFANAQSCAASTTTDTIVSGDTWALNETSATVNCGNRMLECSLVAVW